MRLAAIVFALMGSSVLLAAANAPALADDGDGASNGPTMPTGTPDNSAPDNVSTTAQNEGVMNRPRPEYDAKGISLGGFRLFPELQLSENYDSNVFRQPTDQDDYFFEATPELKLQSQWGRHFLELYSGADYYNYSRFSAEDLTDWNVGGDGRLDISHAAVVSAGAYYSETHEPWSSPNNLIGFQAKPNRYHQTHADVSSTFQPNRLGITLGGSYDRYDWLNTAALGGGTINNHDRDLDEYQAYAKAFYDFSPGYSVFLRGSYDTRQYDQDFDRSGLHRSSNGYRVDGGVDVQVTHLIAGEVFAGYLQQNFSQNVPTPLPDVTGFNYGLNLDWYATPRLTFHITGQRQLENVIIVGASVADDRNIGASADFEILYNLIGQAHLQYTEGRFVGTSRTDRMPDAGVGLKFLLDRYASLNLNYDWSQRSSTSPGVGYTDNLVSLGLRLQI